MRGTSLKALSVLLLVSGAAQAGTASAAEQIEKIPCPSWVVVPGATCAKVKRHPLDPEAVFGDDWKHSDWAYTEAFADRLQVEDRSVISRELPKGLAAVELRVAWDPTYSWDPRQRSTYNCEIHAYIEESLLPYVKLPAARRGAHDTGPLPWGWPKGQGPRVGTDRAAFYNSLEPEFQTGATLLQTFVDAERKRPSGGQSEHLRAYHKNIVPGISYVSFWGSCHMPSPAKSAYWEFWLPAARTDGAPVPVASHADRQYLALRLPRDLPVRAYPYWRRASEISYCYGRAKDPLDPWPPGARERFLQGCDALRRSPIDGVERDPMQLR